MTQPAVQLEKVTMRYAQGPAVLRDLSWTAAQGESIAILGVSGCGKSTLLNLIGTLDRPTEGRIWIDGQEVTALQGTALAALRATKIGFVFQDHHLMPQLSAMENVLVPTLACSADKRGATQRAEALLESVGMADQRHKPPSQLSGGQRQRVAIVRALINQPSLLLVDEPTGALDQATADGVVDLLASLNREHSVTLIMVTHAADLARRMGRVLRIVDGALVPHE